MSEYEILQEEEVHNLSIELHKMKISNSLRRIVIELYNWHLDEDGSVCLWILGDILWKSASLIWDEKD